MVGKLFVIDGTDGSGKATQTEILVQRLKDEGYNVETVDFPQYGQKSAGLVENYLNGNYGTAEEVGPYRASIFFACDRYDASFKIKSWLAENKIIIANRYVTANMGHQGAKITDQAELNKYLNWLYDLEYNVFAIPKPDLNIILHVSAETSQYLVDQKAARSYIADGGKRDIHEADINHLRAAEQTYLKIAALDPAQFNVIECEQEKNILSKDKIAELIWTAIQPNLPNKA